MALGTFEQGGLYRSGRIKQNFCWKYDNDVIDIVDNFNYLGVTLNFNGNFNKTQSVLASQCKKSLSCLLVKMKTLHLNVSTKLSLFDTYISSIANYGCEIWGLHPAHELERVHLDFCKQVLSVKKSTVSMMVYSELGRTTLILKRKYRMIKYWLKLKKSDNCILDSIYQEMLEVCKSKKFSCWLSDVKDLIYSLGFGNVWDSQNVNEKTFLIQVKQRLCDVFIQEMNEFFDKSSKCSLYKYVNDGFKLQLYLKKAIPNVYVQCISKFRMSSHKLEVEQGRYYNVAKNQRICKMCSKSEIEDEFHFLLVCPCYDNFRKMYINKYNYKKPST